jgi:hypothetical protein
MRKLLLSTVLVALIPLPAMAVPPREILDLLRSLEGRSTWLRIDVIRLQYPLNGKDATNVLPDGHVRYRLLMGFRSTESTSTEEFTKDIQRSLQEGHQAGQVRIVGKGSPVKITKAEASDDEVELEIRDSGDSKNKIRFKYDKDKQSFTADNVKKLLAVCFADTEAEAKSDAPTAAIKLGMSVQEVIAVKGTPKTSVDLGPKTILTYPDLKLIFQDGKLADVQ